MKKVLILFMALCLVLPVSANASLVVDNATHWYDGWWQCLLAGVVIGGIAVGVMASAMRSVRSKNNASDYVEGDGLELTRQEDIFLYQTVTRRAKPKNNGGSHRGSSGRSHGGGGGRF